MILSLKPTVYSKSKNLNKIIEKLKKAPEQVANSKEAFEGDVIEFVLEDGSDSRVGTLSEYVENFPKIKEFNIRTIEGHQIIIEKQGSRFFPKAFVDS